MLSAAHRQAIADALVGREVDREQVYLQLERIYEGYQILERDRKLDRPNKARLQQERKEVSELITRRCGYRETLVDQLIDFQQHPMSGHDEIEPGLYLIIHDVESELANLQMVRRRIYSHIDNLDASIRKFHRNNNPHRENMYIGLLRIWTDIIGGKPTFNRPPLGGPPYGPLIDFLRACLTPIPGDKTRSAYGIADIIGRVRNPEEHAKRKKHKST